MFNVKGWNWSFNTTQWKNLTHRWKWTIANFQEGHFGSRKEIFLDLDRKNWQEIGWLSIFYTDMISTANKIWLFQSFFLTNFDFLMTYSYLTTDCGTIFTLSGLSFAYYYVKDTYYEGSLNMVKSWNWMSNSNGYFKKSTHKKYIQKKLVLMINNLKHIVNLNGFLFNYYLLVCKKINMKSIINILKPAFTWRNYQCCLKKLLIN